MNGLRHRARATNQHTVEGMRKQFTCDFDLAAHHHPFGGILVGKKKINHVQQFSLIFG